MKQKPFFQKFIDSHKMVAQCTNPPFDSIVSEKDSVRKGRDGVRGLRFVLFLLFVLAGMSNGVWGATYYWNGTTSKDWNEPSNWDLNSVPLITDTLIINQQINQPEIKAGANVPLDFSKITFGTGANLTVNGILSLTADFDLSNIDTASTGKISTTGDITVPAGGAYTSLSLEAENIFLDSGTSCGALSASSNIIAYGNFTASGDIFAGGSVLFNGELTVIGNISTSGSQNYKRSVTLGTDTQFITYGSGKDITFERSINVASHNIELTLNQGNCFFSEGNTFDNLTITDALTVHFSDDNIFQNLIIKNTTASSSVTFDTSSFQKVNGTLSLTGKSETDRLIFGDAGAWNIYLGGTKSFSYVTVQNSTSKNADNTASAELNIIPSSGTIIDTAPVSSTAWFAHKYFWLGKVDEKWTTSYDGTPGIEKGNWYYDEDGTIPAPVPSYNDGLSEIILKKAVDGNNLELEGDTFTPPLAIANVISISSLNITAGNRFGSAGFTLSLSSATANAFTNNGTFALWGTQTTALTLATGGTATHGNDSTIEYYGSSSDSKDSFAVSSTIAGGVTTNNYRNLAVTKTAGKMTFEKGVTTVTMITGQGDVEFLFEKPFTVTSTGSQTLIFGNGLYTDYANSSTWKPVKVTFMDDVVINSTGNVWFCGSVLFGKNGVQNFTVAKIVYFDDVISAVNADETELNLKSTNNSLIQLRSNSTLDATKYDSLNKFKSFTSVSGQFTVKESVTKIHCEGDVEIKTNYGSIVNEGIIQISATAKLTLDAIADVINNKIIDAQTSADVTFKGKVENKSAGIITCGTGNVTFNGNFMNLGTFTASSGITEFKENFTCEDAAAVGGVPQAPTFNHNSGTVKFSNTGKTLTATNNTVFYNVEIASASSRTTANAFEVAGTNWNNQGTFSATDGTITFSTTSPLTIDGNNTFYDTSFTASNDVTILGNNTYHNLSFTKAGSTVKFAQQTAAVSKVTQTVSGKLTVTGSVGNKITLTTASALPDAEDESTWWRLNLTAEAYPVTDWTTVPAPNNLPEINYVNVEYSYAVSNLIHDWGESVKESVEASTTNWFIHNFYWWGKDGTDNTSWTKPANWSASGTSYTALSFYPPYTKGTSTIIIQENDTGVLKLTTAVEVKSLTVNADAKVDFNGQNVTAGKITNNGTVQMMGTETISLTGASPNLVQGDDSSVEYYNVCDSVPWGQLYRNLVFTDGAVANDISAALTVKGIVKFNNGSGNNIKLSGANIFENPVQIVSGGNLTINCAATKFIEISSMNVTDECDSLTIKGAARVGAQVNTSGNQTYESTLNLTESSTLTGANVIFKNTVSNLLPGTGYDLTVNGAAAVSANITTTDGKQIYNGAVTCNANLTMTASLINFNGGVSAATANKLTLNGVTYITGSGVFGGTVTGSSIQAKENLFIGPLTGDVTIGLGVTADKDFYIGDTTHTKKVIISQPLSVSGNFALFSGNVQANSNLLAGKDIILLSGNYTAGGTMKDGNGSLGTSGYDIFVYNLAERPKAISLSSFPTQVITGVMFSSVPSVSSFTPAGGITIQAGQNFFDNGVSLLGTGNWNLKLKTNTDSTSSFAEVYNASISYCQVSSIGGGDAFLAAANAVDSGNNNANVSFTCPHIKSAQTVYDDVIKVDFADDSGNPLPLENTNNEIWKEFTERAWYFGKNAQIQFSGVYLDVECTNPTSANKGNRTISTVYLKAAVGANAEATELLKWNTDATGISAGDVQSTTRKGTCVTSVPYINLPRALSAVYTGLRDIHKNRVVSYYTETPSLASASSLPGATFTAVTDGCAPVLIEVKVGKENHEAPGGTANTSDYSLDSQQPYDAHNFIEFVYSEPVDIDTLTSDGGVLNAGSTATLGNITAVGSGLKVAGLGQIAFGSVDAASTAGTYLHSLYRKFDAGSGVVNQTHRVRVAVAGYVDGTINSNGKSYYKWTSYITSSLMPYGAVTRIANANIKDKAKNAAGADAPNQLAYTDETNHPLPVLTVAAPAGTPDGTVYRAWDSTPPSFAPLRLNGQHEWNSSLPNYEAVGAAYSGHTYLDAIEIHMFDNEPTFTSGELQWFSKIGWANAVSNTSTTYTDVVSETADIIGGIRYCTLYNQYSQFTYELTNTPGIQNFKTKNIEGGADSAVFKPATGTGNPIGAEDSCYFKIFFVDGANYDPKLTFTVYYELSGSYITDLAGNKILHAPVLSSMPTVDRTSPAVTLTAAPCGKDELYIVISKAINTGTYKVYKDADHSEEINALDYLPKALRVTGAGIQIDDSVPARLVHKTEHATGFIVKLTGEVNWNDIKDGLFIQIQKAETDHCYDPLSGVVADVTYIQDELGNYAEYQSEHAFTDFAVDVVQPEFAYNIDINDVHGNNIQSGLYSEGSWAVHDWSRNQSNYGVLNPDYDVHFKTNIFDGTADNSGGATSITSLRIYYDDQPDANSESKEYNRYSNRNFRIWLPVMFSNISLYANDSSIKTLDMTVTPPAAGDGAYAEYELPIHTSDNFAAGKQVTFLFEIPGLTVQHFGSADTAQPLYFLRLSNPNDVSSLDLWSFQLKNISPQRGGISILNNVINPLEGEKTVIRTDFSEPSRVNIIVMTLDGNIVTYLNRDEVPAGEQFFTWDGRNARGDVVARGLYFVRFVGSGFDETRKVMIVK